MTRLEINEHDVIRYIAPDDNMLSNKYGEKGYFYCGRSALECIEESLLVARIASSEVKRILDLPCGYGRVLRYLKFTFPEAEIFACDILRASVDFCSSTFGATPVYSEHEPAKIPLEKDYFDLIWVGSLFTHLNAAMWLKFLDLFSRVLRPGGLLVFTTHGRESYHQMLNKTFDYKIPYWRKTAIMYSYERTGFGYVRYRDGDDFGLSLSSPAWVVNQITSMEQLRLVHFAAKSWANFHDVYACVRDPDPQRQNPRVSKSLYLKHKVRDIIRPK